MQQRAAPSFGRKGPSAGEAPRRPITFGKADEPSEIDRRREAFIAAERARREEEGNRARFDDDDDGDSSGRPLAPLKSVGTAYILWFLLGAFSGHRFYVGSPSTAFAQISLRLVGILVLLSGEFLLGLYLLGAAFLWLIVDAFLLPDLVRKANARLRGGDRGRVYA